MHVHHTLSNDAKYVQGFQMGRTGPEDENAYLVERLGYARHACSVDVLVRRKCSNLSISPEPRSWFDRAMLFFLSSIMSFVWRSGSEDDPEVRPPLSRKVALAPRIAITAVLAIGVVYLLMIIRTLKRYGSGPPGGSLHGLLHIGHEGRVDRPMTISAEGSSAAGHGMALGRIRTPESDASDQRGRKRQRLEVYEHFQSQRSKSSRRKGSVEKVETEKEEKEIAVVSVNLQGKSVDSL